MIRIYTVDDHAILRAGVAALINAQPDMQCVGEAADGRQALEGIAETAADVALIDLEMPRCDGLKAIELLGKSGTAVKTIALTMHQERPHVQAALAAGASAFIAKHVADRKLLQTIRQVVSGSSFLCLVGEGTRAAQAAQPGVDKEQLSTLSKREQQVLELLVLGNTNREIAAALAIGIKSVETYRARISQKIGLKSRAALVQFAIETGLMQQLVRS